MDHFLKHGVLKYRRTFGSFKPIMNVGLFYVKKSSFSIHFILVLDHCAWNRNALL